MTASSRGSVRHRLIGRPRSHARGVMIVQTQRPGSGSESGVAAPRGRASPPVAMHNMSFLGTSCRPEEASSFGGEREPLQVSQPRWRNHSKGNGALRFAEGGCGLPGLDGSADRGGVFLLDNNRRKHPAAICRTGVRADAGTQDLPRWANFIEFHWSLAIFPMAPNLTPTTQMHALGPTCLHSPLAADPTGAGK